MRPPPHSQVWMSSLPSIPDDADSTHTEDHTGRSLPLTRFLPLIKQVKPL